MNLQCLTPQIWKMMLLLAFLMGVIGCQTKPGDQLSMDPIQVSNPIIHADYSDPDVVRVGQDYYMTASSFNCVPGLPILHSRDLVHWTIIGHAVEHFPQKGYDAVQSGAGVWAPCIRYHQGEFFIYWGDPDRGIYMVKATDPAGPWEAPHLVKAGKGLIDTSPLWDDDGKAYLVHGWAKSRSGINSILTVYEMSPDGKTLLDEGTMVIDGRDNPELKTLEGPKFYKHQGLYYIFAPAGGVAQGWQMVFRSKDIRGPYEMKRVLEQGSTNINGPHQGAWIVSPDDSEWFIHFQDKNAYGRVTHMQTVTWADGWPVMGEDFDGNGIGEPVTALSLPENWKVDPSKKIQTSDEFDSASVGLQWQWMANPQKDWYSLTERPGWLRLKAANPPESPNLNVIPNLLAQKWQSLEFDAMAQIDLSHLKEGDRFGFAVTGMSAAILEVVKTQTGLELIRLNHRQRAKATDETTPSEVTRIPLQGTDFVLRIRISDFAEFQSSYSSDGQVFAPIGEPVKILEGHWIGSKIGFYCLNNGISEEPGYADIDWIRIEPVASK